MKSEKHGKKKDLIVAASIELFAQKGMQKTNLAEILQAADISKGTFYHYFKSKDDLLDAIIMTINDQIMAPMESIINNANLDAPAKFRAWFQNEQKQKSAQKSLMIDFMYYIYAEHNLKLRKKYQDLIVRQLTPFFTRIIEQGNSEGCMQVEHPEQTAFIIIQLGMGVRERSVDKILAGEATPEWMQTEVRIYEQCVERILGTKSGALKLYDREYFDVFAKDKQS